MSRTEATIQNAQNGLSLLQVQDGALETVGKSWIAWLNCGPWLLISQRTVEILKTTPRNSLSCKAKSTRSKSRNSTESVCLRSTNSTNMANGIVMENKTYVSVGSGGNNVSYTSAHGRTLYTAASGSSVDGSISINIVNLQFVTDKVVVTLVVLEQPLFRASLTYLLVVS